MMRYLYLDIHRIQKVGRSRGPRRLLLRRVRVDGDDFRRARDLARLDHGEADGAQAEDGAGGVGLDLRAGASAGGLGWLGGEYVIGYIHKHSIAHVDHQGGGGGGQAAADLRPPPP